MHRTSGLITLAAATFLFGCSGDDAQTPAPQQSTGRQLSASLVGNPGWEHLGGESGVDSTAGAGRFVASIVLDGDEPAAVRPWHVHFDSCGTGGGIVGPATDYTPMTIGDDGSASSTATIAVELDPGAAYHVNVHLSPSDMPTLIACGDLAQPAAGVGGSGGAAGSAGTAGMAGTAGTSGAGGTNGSGGSAGTGGDGGSGAVGTGGSGATGTGGTY